MAQRTYWRFTVAAALGSAAAALSAQATSLPADFPQGTKVSATGTTVSSLLSQLTQQTQIPFTAMRGGDTTLNLTLQDVPLWEAVRRIQDTAGPQAVLEWRLNAANGQMLQQFGEPFSHAGAFVQHISSIAHSTDFGRAQTEMFYANVLMMADPGTRIVALCRESNPAQALDDAGNSLVPDKPAPVEWNMVLDRNGGAAPRSNPPRIVLQRPKLPPRTAPGRTIKVLEGALPILLAGKIDSLRLKLPAHELKSYGDVGTTITWENASFGPNIQMLEVQITFARPTNMSDEEWERTANMFAATRVLLLKPDGTLVSTQSGGESTTSKNRHTSVLFTPPADDPHPEVLIEIPTGYRQVNVPYHFENLPLP